MGRGRPVIPPGTLGEIGTTQLEKGKWLANAQVRMPNGTYKRLRRTGNTEAEAKRNLKTAASEATTTTDTDELKTTSPVNALIEHWLSTHEMSDSSRDVYTSTINNHITKTFGEIRINEVTTAKVEKFLRTMKPRPATAKRARSILSSAFSMAVRFDLMEHNPVRETTSPKQVRKAPRALTDAEWATFFAMIDHYTTADMSGRTSRAETFPHLMRFIAGTGVRLSEALRMRWEDIDLESKPPTAIVRPTKDGGESTRVIQLPHLAADAVQQQSNITRRIFPYVFPTGAGTYVPKSTVQRWMRRAREVWATADEAEGQTDVSWVTPHSFRRHIATLLADEVSLLAASQQLGHADSTITEYHYLERSKSGPPVAEVLNRKLDGGKKMAKKTNEQ